MDGVDFGIVDYTGLESTDYEITTQNNISGYGAKITGKKMLPRPVSVEFESQDFAGRAAMRQDIIGFFTPYSTGTLTVSHMGTIREIAYEVQSFATNSRNVNDHVSGLVELICINPAFLGATLMDQIATWIGGWKWKFSLPFKMRTSGASRAIFVNGGHLPAPPMIEFHGPADYPLVRNVTTGAEIRVNRQLASSEVLYINTDFGNKSVEIEHNGVRANAFNYIDIALMGSGSFNNFWLLPGENIIEYETENATVPQQVVITYRERYLGV